MDARTKKLQELVKTLFEEDQIDLFIGFQEGTVPLKSRPLFIDAKEEDRDEKIDTLTWDSFCTNNLAVFLPKYFQVDPHRRKGKEAPKPRIGLSVKGCDQRSVVTIIKEKQVPRENVILVGVPCSGMIDKRKAEEQLEGDDEVTSFTEKEDGSLHIETREGQTLDFDREVVLRDACLDCRFPMPEATDHLLEGQAREPGDGGYARIKEFQQKSRDERWDYFRREFEKCIRCNACRQACPTCYCKECFAEQQDMGWIGATTDITDTMIFHLIRVFHQAGRCVECDACYSACPEHVDLRTLTKKMVMDVEELFGYVPDFSTETVPPLSTFAEGDSEQFITDPDKG